MSKRHEEIRYVMAAVIAYSDIMAIAGTTSMSTLVFPNTILPIFDPAAKKCLFVL